MTHRRTRRATASRARGFTLVELLLALAIFSLLASGSWRLFEGLVRADRAYREQAAELERLSRAMTLIQRDALHALVVEDARGVGHGVSLDGVHLRWLRGGARDGGTLPRSELRVIEYWVADAVLWRQVRTLERAEGRPQRVLENVRELRWRVHAHGAGWHSRWPVDGLDAHALRALDVQLSTDRYRQIRRVVAFAREAR